MRRILKEPILWFFVIGIVLFAVDRLNRVDTIVVDETVRQRIAALWQTQMGRAPTDDELSSLTAAWVREEVFYREALRLGLDRDDTIIRRRLVQKLGFLIQDVADEVFSAEAIDAYYQANIEAYTLPARYSFSHVYYNDESRTAELLKRLQAGENWQTLGDSTLLQKSYVSKSEREIISELGTAFAGQVDQLRAGEWVGPLKSSYGLHLVLLDRLVPAEATPLAYIERRVVADMQRKNMDDALESYFEELLGQYDVDYR